MGSGARTKKKGKYEFICARSGMVVTGETKEEALSLLMPKKVGERVHKYPMCPGCGHLIRPEKLKWVKRKGVFTAVTGKGVYFRDKKLEEEERKLRARERRKYLAMRRKRG